MAGRKISQLTRLSSLGAADVLVVARPSPAGNFKADPDDLRKLLFPTLTDGDVPTYAEQEEDYTTGTVGIVDGVVTLSGGTWPSWAASADLLVSGELYSVATRTDDTHLVLDDTTVDVTAGASFRLKYGDLVAQNPRYRVVDATKYTTTLPRYNVSGVSFTKAISGITDATPCVVTTSTGHGLETGDVVVISGTGEAGVDGIAWTITKVLDTTFQLDGSSTSTLAAAVGAVGTVTHLMVVTLDFSPRTIATPGSSNTTPIVITTTATHPYKTGETVTIASHSVSAVNGTWSVIRISDTTFSLTGSTAAGVGNGGTVIHARPSHGFRTGTHLTLESIGGATQANGTFTIDSRTNEISTVTAGAGNKILITTVFPHGYSDSDQIRVESVNKVTASQPIDESEGTWEITVVSATTFLLDTLVVTGTASAFSQTYDRGGICTWANKFRLIEDSKFWNGRRNYVIGDIVILDLIRYTCILANTNQKPPNATYWTVVTPAAYTSGGTVIIPGQITIDAANSPAMKPPYPATAGSSGSQRQAAVAAAAVDGWTVGLPIRLTTASQTVYGLIVGVPGAEGFPYTDPCPLPFYFDNVLQYAGPPLTGGTLTEVAVGRPGMVHFGSMPCTVLPYFGATCELPLNPLDFEDNDVFGTLGGGNSLGTYGKTFKRWDGPPARIVAFASQQDTAAVNGDWGEFSGGDVAIIPDSRRPGIFTNGVPDFDATRSLWVNSRPYYAGEIAKDTGTLNLYVCTVSHNLDGSGQSQDPSAVPAYWRDLHATTLTWSGATAYVRDDIVVVSGQLYICILAHTNFTPPNTTYWRETDLAIAPATWAAGTYTIGNIVERNGVNYRVTAASTTQTPTTTTINSEWALAIRETYEDGSTSPGSRITRNDVTTSSFSPGHPDSGVAGWQFTAVRSASGSAIVGKKTVVRDSCSLPPIVIVSASNATPIVVTTATDHEFPTASDFEVTITGSSVAAVNGIWRIDVTAATTFTLIGSTASGAATGGVVIGNDARRFIVEDLEMPEVTVAAYRLNDYPLQPKWNIDIGGQMLSTNDSNSGIRTRRYDNAAEWNQANEVNPNSYDLVYNTRMAIAATSLGNQPGIFNTAEDALTTYTTGTVQVDHGVVTLTGGMFPIWRLAGEMTLEGYPVILRITTAAAWDAGVTYLAGQIATDAGKVWLAVTPVLATPPAAAAWTDLGNAETIPAQGYDTHLQTTNPVFSCPAGTNYVLRPQGDPPKWLTVFFTIVEV